MTGMHVVVRPIDLSDDDVAARVVEIQRAAYRIEADLIGFDGIPPLHDTVVDVRSVDLQWLGSWEHGELAGIIAWTLVNGVCDIDRLAVHPTFMRRGHGRALIGPLLRHEVVTVSTGSANAPARRLYESLGFVPHDVREIAAGVTVVSLRRELITTVGIASDAGR
ncbi:MAG: GNAT family N-acetyltransferase [Ilumatobacteraceae bacterium]